MFRSARPQAFLTARPVRITVLYIVLLTIAGVVIDLLGLVDFPWSLLIAAIALLVVVSATLIRQRAVARPTQPVHALEAVWFADIVDYTTFAHRDERQALRLVHLFQRISRQVARRFGGRIVKFLGDGVLAEFRSSEAAVRAADQLQRRFSDEAVPMGFPGQLRIGVHVGDIAVLADGDVYGEGVNGAARLQAAAEPGQILVSEDVWRQLRGRPELTFRDDGERKFKGSPEPTHVFSVVVVGEAAREGEAADLVYPWSRSLTAGRWWIPVAGVVLTLAIAIAVQLLTRSEPAADQVAILSAAPGIAVLPFTVSGTGIEEWREGMIDLVSTNLGGVSGIRAIDSRTVLARWRDSVDEDESPDLAIYLQVGRSTGARYALVGSAVRIGPQVRLVADLYDLESDSRLDQVLVAGPPDSVFMLVDRLSIDVLRSILGEEATPNLDLAGVTTDSLTALKAYLEGEALFRRSEFPDAIEYYERAVAVDSTFALALRRLSEAYSWSGFGGPENGERAIEAAVRHAGRLPEREVALAHATRAFYHGTLDGIRILERFVERYPDDADAWTLLGDSYFHFGDQVLKGPAVADEALARAIELDPSFTPPYIHHIDLSFLLEPDSARVARLIDAFGRVSRESHAVNRPKIAFQLAFGSSDARARARSQLLVASVAEQRYIGQVMLVHPEFVDVQEEVLEAVRVSRAVAHQGPAAWLLFFNRLRQGQIESALRTVDDPSIPPSMQAMGLYMAWKYGIPVPEGRLSRALSMAQVDSTDDAHVFYAGAYAVERGRWSDHERALRLLHGNALEMQRRGDLVGTRNTLGMRRALEALALWRRENPEGALRLLVTVQNEVAGHGVRGLVNATIRLWLGDLLSALGRPLEAIPYFESLRPVGSLSSFAHPLADYRLGRLYDQVDDRARARAAYARFIDAWGEAEPELQPKVERARQSLGRQAGKTDDEGSIARSGVPLYTPVESEH